MGDWICQYQVCYRLLRTDNCGVTMLPIKPAIRKLLLNVLAGLPVYCCMAILSSSSAAESPVTDSVIVYSKTNLQSDKVLVLGRNDGFYIKMELLNGAERWCAVNNSNDRFIGYALCEQLEKIKKRTPVHKRIKPVAEKQKKDNRLNTRLSDNADSISVSAAPVKDAEKTLNTVDNVSAPLKHISSATVAVETGMAISKKAIGMFFVTVFILVTLLAFLIDIFKRNYSQINSYFTAAQNSKTDLQHTGGEAGRGAEAVTEGVSHSATGKAGKELQAENREVDLSDSSEPVEYQFWDCVVRKADLSTVNTLVKCQICGTVQPLASDFKCIECSSDMTYYIEVKNT